MTTKFLIALATMQTLVLFFLCVRVLEIDTQTDELAADFAYARATVSSTDMVSSEAPAGLVRAGPSLAQIRAVVKQEVTLAVNDIAVPKMTETRQASLEIQNARSPEENDAIKANISRELNLYIQSGSAGEMQIASLQSKIAKLPPAEQRKMLGKLVGAINSGDLDARL